MGAEAAEAAQAVRAVAVEVAVRVTPRKHLQVPMCFFFILFEERAPIYTDPHVCTHIYMIVHIRIKLINNN